jgi:uncharacterized protein
MFQPNWTHPRHEHLWQRVRSSLEAECDLAHDWLHVYRVYRWAVRLAPEAEADGDLAGAAALIHDLVNIPKESADRPMGSSLSAAKGASILPAAGYSAEETDAVVEAVRTCSWSRGLAPTSGLGKALQDADRLDAIGAIGIARNIACAQAMSSRGSHGTLYEPSDPLAANGRSLDDKRHAIDHFACKLLKLAETMHLPAAKTEAARRHRFLHTFLAELEQDIQ